MIPLPLNPGRVRRPAATLVLLVLATFLCGGCIINTGSRVEQSGRQISTQTLEQIQAGRKMDFVQAVLGEPTTRSTLAGGTEIWKYQYREKRTRSGTVLFLFSGDNTTVIEHACYVEFQDGAVTRSWQD